MNDQPPPPRAAPPAPTGEWPPSSNGKSTDNPIAVAGLVVSLLGVVLSLVIVGGLVGLVGVTLSLMGLRRSKTLGGRGRGAAIGGVGLGLFAVIASVGFLVLIIDAINGGEPIERDGITTRSTNTEFPPQDDIVEVSCEASDSGSLALAVVRIENMSPERSTYHMTVEWDTDSGATVSGSVRSEQVEPGADQSLRLFADSSSAVSESCRVTNIERSSFGFLD